MDSRVKSDLRRLVKIRAEQEALTAAGKPAPKLEVTSLGKPIAAASGQGIASPLTEPDATARTYYSPGSLLSTDGLFTIAYERLHELHLLDNNDLEVLLVLDDPDA